jgi:hypothetical protein
MSAVAWSAGLLVLPVRHLPGTVGAQSSTVPATSGSSVAFGWSRWTVPSGHGVENGASGASAAG